MKASSQIFIYAMIFFLFPGCGRVIDWGKQTFNQGEKRDFQRNVINDHVRTVKVYNGVSKVGLFSVLWLSDDVRSVYADLDAARYGKSQDAKKAFLRRQLAESGSTISFYVLAFVPQNVAPLGDKQSPWTILLKSNGQFYTPRDVKDVDLNPQYLFLLRDHWTRFKTIYQVKFAVKDLDGNDIITKDTKNITLHFSTIDQFEETTWELDGNGVLKKEDDGE